MKSGARAEGPEEYRRMLAEKRRSILAGIGSKFEAPPKPERVAEEDLAPISHDEFVALQLSSLDYAQLRMIEEALDRLGTGDYGTCLACDAAIPQTRLRALPWARYCLACQQRIGAEGEE